MKLTLTFEHAGKRHNVGIQLDGLPSRGDSFNLPLKRIDPFYKV